MPSLTMTYTVIGALFGGLFPFFSILVTLIVDEMPLTLSSIWILHLNNPLLFVIDTAPIFLGGVATLAGYRHQQLSITILSQENLIKQQTNTLVHALDQALEANQIKDDFLANMNHELRTPLNAIIGYCEMIQEDYLVEPVLKGEDLTLISSDISKVQQAGKHLLSLIDDLLVYTKLDAQDLHISPSVFDLHHALRDVKELMEPFIIGKPVVLNFFYDQIPDIFLLGDRARFQQILINLLENAIKFTKEGSVSLRLTLHPPLRELKPHSSVQLVWTIQDTGVGIEPMKLESILDPFVQGEEAMTKRFGGAGLGLSITKRLCELMDGDLHIDSRGPELGTTVEFSLKMTFMGVELDSFLLEHFAPTKQVQSL